MTLMAEHFMAADDVLQREVVHVATIAVILVIGEITPKTYGSLHAEQVSLGVAQSVRRLTHLLSPIVRVLTAVSQALFHAAGTGLERRAELMTPGQIRVAAELGVENGQVTPEETEILESVIELTETTAREVMVPRVDLTALPLTATIDEVVTTALDSGHSRIPVYDDTVDDIAGILYVNDLLATPADQWESLDLAEIIREPLLVPESKRVDELLWIMRERSTHLAVLIDEFGSTEGLVTVEDILEELVGEIEDEHDSPVAEIELVSANEAYVDGKARIAEVNETLGTNLPEDECETVAGLVSVLAGHIPAQGQVIDWGPVQLVVEEGNEQQVERLHIIAPPGGGSESA
jgi:CBS domain containing-hemolysin-like protein